MMVLLGYSMNRYIISKTTEARVSNTQLASRDEKTHGCAPICVSTSVHVDVLIDVETLKGRNTFLCGKEVGHCHSLSTYYLPSTVLGRSSEVTIWL